MGEEYLTQVKVPKARIAVVIGKGGSTKRELEEATGCKLYVDTADNYVSINSPDPLKLYSVQQIIKGIARGFSPRKALLLLKSDYVLEIIELRTLVKKQHMIRVKGRVIGERGKSRATLEHLTDTFISVYGKTISIIGRPESVALAKRAILNLIQGSPHANVYKWLEKRRSELAARELLGPEYIKEDYKDE